MSNKMLHYSPQELIDLYPQVKKIGWTAQKIGTLFRCGFFVGYFSGKERKAMILESSFIKTLKFVNGVNSDRNIIDLPD